MASLTTVLPAARRAGALAWAAGLALAAAGALAPLADLLPALWPFLVLLVLALLLPPLLLQYRHGRRPPRAAAWLAGGWGLLLLLALSGVGPERLPGRWADALTAAAVLLAAAGAGARLCRGLLPELAASPARLALSLLFGLGGLSLAVLGLGAAGLSGRPAALLLLLGAGAAGWGRWGGLAADARAGWRGWSRRAGGTELLLANLLLLGLWLSLPPAFLPPLDYDVTEYHAQLPREYVEAGRVAFRPHNLFSGMPQNMEMLTTLVFALRGPRAGWGAAKLLNWSFLPLLLLAVAAGARRLRAGAAGALAAAAVILLAPLSTLLAGKLYVELGLVAYGAGSVLALLLVPALPAARGRLALAAGLLAGLAAGTKYPGLLFIAAPVVLLAGTLAPAGGARRRPAALCLLGVALAFGPWLLKHGLETGNPVYPLWNRALGVADWSAEQAARFHRAHRPARQDAAALCGAVARSLGGAELLPFGALFAGALLLAPPGAAGKRGSQPRTAGLLLLWALAMLILWLALTHRLARFLYPLMLPLALAAAAGWARAGPGTRRAGAAGLAAAAVAVGFLVLYASWLQPLGPGAAAGEETLGVLWGRRPPAAVLRHARAWRTGRRLADLPPGRRVLLLGEAACYWLPSRVGYAVVFSRHPLERLLAAGATPEELAAALAAAGYTDLLITWPELARLHATYHAAFDWSPAAQARLRGCLRRHAGPARPLEPWPPWPGGEATLPAVADEDRRAYAERFGPAGLWEGSAYLGARPWLGRLALRPGAEPSPGQRYLLELWRSWAVLLAPTAAGGPPPLGRHAVELLPLAPPPKGATGRP